MKIQESAQDYLESILILSRRQDVVRATDICSYFGYARATVSVFLKQLRENGYVKVDEHKQITLTEERPCHCRGYARETRISFKVFKGNRCSGGHCSEGCMPNGTLHECRNI